MYFEDVLPQLRSGKKIARKSWDETYWKFNVCNNTITQCGIHPVKNLSPIGASTILADDWYILKETISMKELSKLYNDLSDEIIDFSIEIKENIAKIKVPFEDEHILKKLSDTLPKEMFSGLELSGSKYIEIYLLEDE